MDPEDLSRAVRETVSPAMAHRRGIVALSLAAASSMALIALYQAGVIKHLPEPPLPRFDADKVDASAEAFERFQVGDAFLGFVSYGVTAALAAMGPPDRATRQSWIPIVLAGKIGFDVAQAAKLTVDQWVKHKAFCFWCLLAAGATFAMPALAAGEAKTAWNTLTGAGSANPEPNPYQPNRACSGCSARS